MLAALIPLALVGLDPAGWYWFGPVKWLVVSTLVPAGAALVLLGRPVRLVTRPFVAAAAVVAVFMVAALFGVDARYAWLGTPERHFGAVTWLICLPRLGDLIQVLFLSGPLVASAIWPVIAGLYWRRTGDAAAVAALVSGSAVGLWCYFAIGWYAASLVSAAVSMVVLAAVTAVWPARFDWSGLDEAEPSAHEEAGPCFQAGSSTP